MGKWLAGLIAVAAVAAGLFWWMQQRGAPAVDSPRSADDGSVTNTGAAYLENRDQTAAVEVFTRATTLAPDDAVAWRNLARAHLIGDEASDGASAQAAVARALALDPQSAAGHYLLGLAHKRQTKHAEAAKAFEAAAARDARSAVPRFQAGRALEEAGRLDDAEIQLRDAVRLDPRHAAAHYRLSRHAARRRDMDAARQFAETFRRLKGAVGAQSDALLERCVHTEPETTPVAASEPAPWRVRFTETAAPAGAERATIAAVLDVDAGGRVEIIAIDDAGRLHRWGPAASKAEVSGPALPGPWTAIAVGDFRDRVPEGEPYVPETHATADFALVGPGGVRLIEQTGPSQFEDVTEAAGLAGARGHAIEWVDIEHDGDLDLAVGGDDGVTLWRNRGDGRFEDGTADAGLAEAGGVVDLAAVDLEGDVGVDLIFAAGDGPTRLYGHQGIGRLQARAAPTGEWPAARRVVIDDFDNDMQPDAALVTADRVAFVYGGARTRDHVAHRGGPIARLDADGDGWLDLVTDGPRLWRNEAGRAWREVTAETFGELNGKPGKLAELIQLIAVDFDADGDTDLIAIAKNGGARWLRNDAEAHGGQLVVRPVGLKTNPSAIGTHVSLRAGGHRVSRFVGTLPVTLGLGGHETVDAVRIVWGNGVIDNTVNPPVGRALVIEEKKVATGSCPFLYVWDGEGFRFASDLLGNSPVGLPLRRDLLLPADPDELVEIGDIAPRDGAYLVEVTSEFREVLYLDEARLVAVDHPSDVEVHPTDKIQPPPFPKSEIHGITKVRSAANAIDFDGTDTTDELRNIDGRFTGPGLPLPPPLRGIVAPRALTFDFGPLDPQRPLVLLLTGWLQYGDASTNIAASQNPSLKIIPPSLEVEIAPDRWQPVDVVVGMPAGKTKTILVDLAGALPNGAGRLRLTTTFELRWDRVAIGERTGDPVTHHVAPNRAELRWRGFSDLRQRASNHPTTPDYDNVAPRPPWAATPAGWVTRFGDVLPLVGARDARLALAHGGDAISLAFPVDAFPAVPAGSVRTFFFYTYGWAKDGDPNVEGAAAVAPLPEAAPGDWVETYNTRWVARMPWGDR